MTLRVYQAGRARASLAFDTLLRDLATEGFKVVNQQREFTLYDGRAELDAGWLDPPRQEVAS